MKEVRFDLLVHVIKIIGASQVLFTIIILPESPNLYFVSLSVPCSTVKKKVL